MSIIFQLSISILFLISFVSGDGEVVLEDTFSFKPHGSGTAHGLSASKITLVDKKTIKIDGLRYDGKGPDAYWMVGYGTPPVERPDKAPGHKIPNEKGSCDVLKAYNGESITLTLPAEYQIGGSQANSIDWLAMYCIAYKHNFGHVQISKSLNMSEHTTTEPLPKACGEGRSCANNGGFLFLGIFCLSIIGKVF